MTEEQFDILSEQRSIARENYNPADDYQREAADDARKAKQLYFETLAAAVDAIFARAYADKCVFARPSEVWTLCQDHLAYDTNRTGDFQLTSRKGKPTRAYYHALICRLSSGRYELTTYAL